MKQVSSTPGRHGPRLLSAALPPVMGSLLRFRAGDSAADVSIYITGDTLVHDDLREIPRRFPEIDLALLHLGGTRVMGVMLTMDSRQGVELLRLIPSDTAIPIHYNDYTVFKSPLDDFRREAEAAGLSDRVRYLAHGETYLFETRAATP